MHQPRRSAPGAGLLAASSVLPAVSRDEDGHGRGKREKADDEQEQIAGFTGSYDGHKKVMDA